MFRTTEFDEFVPYVAVGRQIIRKLLRVCRNRYTSYQVLGTTIKAEAEAAGDQ